MNIQPIFQHFWEAFIEHAFQYFLYAFPFFFIFWIVWKKRFQSIRIQQVERATTHHFKHDLLHSASTFFVFATLDVVLLYFQSKGYTLLYFDINQYGWAWLVISFALVLFINDAFFYWSHRAMHHPKLYKFFHHIEMMIYYRMLMFSILRL